MYKAKTLIISKRKELSIKYKKLIEAIGQDAVYTNDLSQSLTIIQNDEIDFIIISDTIKEKLSEFVKKIRVLTYNFHPVIIAISKSSELEDKLETLEAGADDFLGEEISKQEFQMRYKAHLRRHIESSLNPVTNLLNRNITIKEMKKSLKRDDDVSYVLLKVRGLDEYRLTHGEIAAEKVLQTLCAMVNSTISNNDYIGHILDDEFLLITNSFNAEKLSAFLVFAFDNILNKFYSVDEFDNNFTIQYSDSIQEAKSDLMRLNISVLEKNENLKDFRIVINSLNELMKLCLNSKKSTYIVDRIKLNGKVSEKSEKNKVLILEFDETLAYLLKNVCELDEIQTEIAPNYADFERIYDEFEPDVVILDWGKEKKSKSVEIANKIRNKKNNKTKLIFSSVYLNKEEILKAGADLYLPKPYEINDMIEWVKRFLEK